MGLTLEFLITDQFHLAQILEDEEEYRLPRSAIEQSADFSFRLIPHDLDLLSEAIGESMELPPWKLRPYLSVLVDKRGHGILMVDHEWVDYAAAVPDSKINDIIKLWAQKAGFSEEIADAGHLQSAVRDLIILCVTAKRKSVPVLHRWVG